MTLSDLTYAFISILTNAPTRNVGGICLMQTDINIVVFVHIVVYRFYILTSEC